MATPKPIEYVIRSTSLGVPSCITGLDNYDRITALSYDEACHIVAHEDPINLEVCKLVSVSTTKKKKRVKRKKK